MKVLRYFLLPIAVALTLACLPCGQARADYGYGYGYKDELDCMRLALSNLAKPERGPERLNEEDLFPRYDEAPAHFLLSKKDMPWTASYFAMSQRGIAIRWQSAAVRNDLLDKSRSPAKVLKRLRAMSPEQINELSPAEKYDIFTGRYDFPVTRTELTERGTLRTPRPAYWEGFCNGLCAASIELKEPTHAIQLENPDGVVVPFEPNDIKALAAASYFYVEKYAQIGSPNRTALDINFESIPNPGAFDWALTHYLTKLHKGFVVDVHPGRPIFNHVVIGYSRRLGELESFTSTTDDGSDAAWRVRVRTRVIYTENTSHEIGNTDTAAGLVKGKHQLRRDYTYDLVLDSKKRVIGGEWPEDADDAPDFLWFPAGKGTDAEMGLDPYLDFEVISKLVDRASKAPIEK